MKAKQVKVERLPFSADDFNWCVKNDFQIYLYPMHLGRYRIAMRRGGISSCGKDKHLDADGLWRYSKEVIGEMEFKDLSAVSAHLPYVYKSLREKYS